MGEGEHNKLISKNHSGPRVFIDKSLTLISLELKATLNVQGGKCSNCLGKETSFSCFVGMPSSSKSTCISVVLCHTKHDTHMRCNKYTITQVPKPSRGLTEIGGDEKNTVVATTRLCVSYICISLCGAMLEGK